MVVKSIIGDGAQPTIFDESERLVDEHMHPEMQDLRDELATLRIDVPRVCAELTALTERGREAGGERDIHAATIGENADDVSTGVAEVDAWRDEARELAELAVLQGVPGAVRLRKRLDPVLGSVDSYRESRKRITRMLEVLEDREAQRILGVDAAWVQRGRSVAGKLRDERGDMNEGALSQQLRASEVAEVIEQIAARAEQLAIGRSIAERRTGKRWPGFDLSYLRSAIARRRTRRSLAPEAEVDAATPEAPIGDGLPGLPGLPTT